MEVCAYIQISALSLPMGIDRASSGCFQVCDVCGAKTARRPSLSNFLSRSLRVVVRRCQSYRLSS